MVFSENFSYYLNLVFLCSLSLLKKIKKEKTHDEYLFP